MYLYHNFFIQSSVDGHPSCFHVPAIVHSASMNNGLDVSFSIWFPQGICLGVGLLGHMVVLFLVFRGLFIPSSIVALSIYIPTNSARAFLFFHILSRIYGLFDDGHSNWCEVISLCSFDLHFSNNEQC